MDRTLYTYLKPKAPAFSSLHKKYNPVLQLVDVLIGVIPNCDPIMEIWPTSFRTYNLLVPNLLNLPASLFGNKSVKTLMGLAMYQASDAAGCNYCTAHTCSFAIRRGLSEAVILGEVGEKESAVINFSRKMAQIPCKVTKEDYLALKKYCTKKEVESVSMGIVLMGFLNKFMDVLGTELEQEAIDDVSDLLSSSSWEIGKHSNGTAKISDKKNAIKKDSLSTYFRVIRQAPGAIQLEKKWTKGVPNDLEKINTFLKDNIGHHFSILSKLSNNKQKRAVATILRDNFSASNTPIGLKTKVLCGLIFSKIIKNTYLENELLILSKNNNIHINEELQNQLTDLSNNLHPNFNEVHQNATPLSKQEIAAMHFTVEASSSPASIEGQTMLHLTNQLSPEALVELVTWISILQALHRLEKLPVA